MSPLQQSDLALIALRYLAGELDAVAAEAFELSLASDDAVQRALVEAVQISAAIQSSEPAPAVMPATRVAATRQPQRASRWSGAIALIGSGLVAATALVALRDEPGPAAPVASLEEANSGATVSLWTELNVEDVEASIDDSSLFESDGDGADEVQVPDWMFAAIETDFAAGDAPTDPVTDSPSESDKDS